MGNALAKQSKKSLQSLAAEVPDDILFEIFIRVPSKDIAKSLTRVCKRWQSIIDSEGFWRAKCAYDRVYTSDILHSLPDENAKLLYFKKPYMYNLIQNPDSSREFEGWKIIRKGGNGWQYEKTPIGSDPVENFCGKIDKSGPIGCWATSYSPCSKKQVIDLLKIGCTEQVLDNIRPSIKVSEWYSARFDCGIKYKLFVQLLKEEDSYIVDEWTFSDTQPAGREWFQAEHTFSNYGKGVRFINFYHEGVDTQFWAGHYGAKMTLSTVIINVTSPAPSENTSQEQDNAETN